MLYMRNVFFLIFLSLLGFQCSSPSEKLSNLVILEKEPVIYTEESKVEVAGLLPFTNQAKSVRVLNEVQKEELITRLSIPKLFSDNIAFTENKGQLESIYKIKLKDIKDVKFYTKGFGGTAYFSSQGIGIGFIKGRLDHALEMEKVEHPALLKMKRTPRMHESMGFNILFENSNKDVEILGGEIKEHKINYFRGNDPAKFITDISSYEAIEYKGLYKNIDLKYYISDRQLQYDYTVHPGGNIEDISLHYSGVKGLSISKKGELEIATDWGILTDKKLYSYQIINGKKKIVNVAYKVKDHDKVTFEVKGKYNKEYALVIDPPTLTWSTFLGGNDPAGNGYVHDIALDAAGNVYGTGWYNDRFPMNSAFDNVFGADEQVVFKLNAAGTALAYSSFIGGGNLDYAFGIAVDASNNAYVTGNTMSTDFPVVGALRATNSGGTDITISKINAAGNALLYSSYYGGTGNDYGWTIGVNAANEAYIAGSTNSTTTIASAGAYQTAFGGATDAFVLKLTAAGNAVSYCTYYGGTGDDLARDIVLKSTGDAYIAGATTSTTTIASAGSFATVFGGGSSDGFIAVINNAGNGRVYGAYAGGTTEDKVEAIDLKSNGEAVLYGYTRSYIGAGGFPSVNAYQANNGAAAGGPRDAFMMRVNATGSALLNSTFYGTAGEDAGRNPTAFDVNTQHRSGGIAVNANGDIAMVMSTDATTLATVSSVDATYNGDGGSLGGLGDVYIAIFDPTGVALSFTTYLGGANHDYATAGIRWDPSNPLCIVVAGANHSDQTTFPTTAGSYLPTRGATTTNDQGFITKYCNVVLPVELLYFHANYTSNGNVLTEWKTATELNNHYFLVQRSSDGIHFETIGRVEGSGTSNQLLTYSFVDTNPLEGRSYYRLTQVDFDGKSGTSKIETVLKSAFNNLNVSPNPSNGNYLLTGNFASSLTLELSIVDALGKEILKSKELISEGLFEKQIDISRYADGVYLLVVKTQTESTVIKLIKK